MPVAPYQVAGQTGPRGLTESLMETVVRLFGSSRSFHSRLIKKHFIGHDDCRVLGRAWEEPPVVLVYAA